MALVPSPIASYSQGYGPASAYQGVVYSSHPQYEAFREDYELLDDVMAGSSRIKSKNDVYLPVPNSVEYNVDSVRYQQYKKRAIFINITGRMASTLVGLGYLREPKITLPSKLKMLEEDADGTGLSLLQFSKEVALEVITYGRAGILVDFPSVTDARRRRALGDRLRPYLKLYHAQEIVNWNYAGCRLQFVVLKRQAEVLNSYAVTLQPQWRLLEMSGGNRDDFSYGGKYVTRTFRVESMNEPTGVTPLDANGNPFDRILFHFCGSRTNSGRLSSPPLAPVADLNVGLYRNSADGEELAFLSGQPTPVFWGADSKTIKELADKKIELGSRKGVIMGPGGGAVLLQANPNSLVQELARDKIITMQQLGVELAIGTGPGSRGSGRSGGGGGSHPQTATQVATEGLIRNSVLLSSLQNVSMAITKALKDACLFVGADPESVKFEIDTSIDLDPAAAAVSMSVTGARGLPSQPRKEADNA